MTILLQSLLMVKTTMTINDLAAKLKGLKSALIFSHNRPDGDTVASATALKIAFESLGIKADLVCEVAIPEKLKIVKYADAYLLPGEVCEKYDAHIAVDCSVESVFGSNSYALYLKNRVKFNVDHHVSNSRHGCFNYVEQTAACAEVVYKLICALGVSVDADMANCLLMGVVSDTGGFVHSNVTENTLYIAANLSHCGGDLHLIAQKLFKSQTKERAKLYARIISSMRYYLEDKIAVLIITLKDLEETGASSDMTEGFIDFAMTVQSVEVGVSLLQTADKRYKVSFRSRGKVNVNEIAAIYGGGGHILASGAIINGYLEDIVEKICYNVKQRL